MTKEWGQLSDNALGWMRQLGKFSPTACAKNKELKGYTLSEDGEGGKTYWDESDLRQAAEACIEVADWLEQTARESK